MKEKESKRTSIIAIKFGGITKFLLMAIKSFTQFFIFQEKEAKRASLIAIRFGGATKVLLIGGTTKVLLNFFQKIAVVQKAEPSGRSPQRAKHQLPATCSA